MSALDDFLAIMASPRCRGMAIWDFEREFGGEARAAVIAMAREADPSAVLLPGDITFEVNNGRLDVLVRPNETTTGLADALGARYGTIETKGGFE